jgi:phosphoglycerol transferase MdoB-like AlkP superfamily enzyme
VQTYLKQNIKLFKVYLIGLLLFAGLRLIYLIRFGEEGIFSNYGSDLVASFITGIRYDTQILCYAFVLIFILNFLFFINKAKLNLFLIKFSKFYSIIVLALLVFIILIDHQFYTYFQTHLNILVYGFMEDDTSAVMSSVWSDHPIIKISISYLILVFLLYKTITKIYSSKQEFFKISNPFLNIGFVIVFLTAFLIGVRGSIGTFPLQIDDSTVSENRFINSLTLNGLFTLEKAIEERNESNKPRYKPEVLKNSGYNSIKEVMADYYGQPIDSFPSENYLDYLFLTTPKDSLLEADPPNVIFILMESFGGYYLNFHSDQLNLLGSLDNHMDDGVLFTNFLSSTQGTIYSLESIIINKDHPILSNSNRRFESFNSSIAYPYKKAGYHTTFVTGGKLGWRNLQDFIPNQHFDEAYGKAKIIKNNPNSVSNTWGVYDEYLFDDIFNQLSEHPNKPKLIYGLSTTNHTPYELPKSYKPYPVEVSDSLKNIIIANSDVAELNFTAYQYANDCLGKFITKLKASKYGKNTIVAVSGDHNSYALFPHNNSKIKEEYNHIVPFLLFIPKKYKKGLTINEKRYGSHKDIFPTLINLSLSKQKYFSLGNDLFDNNVPDSLFYGVNDYFYYGDPLMSKQTLDKKVKARNVLNHYYFAQ